MEVDQEYENFLSWVKKLLGKEKEFAVMTYPDGRTLFKILLDRNTQFTAEIKDYEKLGNSSKITLLFHHLFKTEMIKGSISMEEIIKDALPTKGLENFFHPNPKSIYKTSPIGKHGGYITFYEYSPVILKLRDSSELANISGKYFLGTKGEREKDKKGRNCLILYLELIEK
jgi:hypothetical protein